MVDQITSQSMQARFREAVHPRVMEQFSLSNRHQVPRLVKIVVNVGIGRFLENQKLKQDISDTVFSTLQTITGQKPIMVKAKKSVANFKVRAGAPSAIMVTLRSNRMWHFLDRLLNLAIPRMRDFRGLSTKSFDGQGNYSLGLSEQAVWPEINMSTVTFTHGMHVTLVFEDSNPAMSEFILSELGMPFERKEDVA